MAQSPQAQSLPVENALEVDEGAFADTDLAYNESIGTASYMSSLSSSVKNYKMGVVTTPITKEHPDDEEEQDRMDLWHHIYLLLLGGELHLARIKNPRHVLDLGTGTGIWAIQFAE
ncbi:hypothetical protein VTN77DRAFT_1650 [Rasamsonia byssochlamydoides]|uniref:uncharacterized protein n=1 Tax=Rasamsonia byssochlamydoides TaxID=89139 RepID=UPI0037444898